MEQKKIPLFKVFMSTAVAEPVKETLFSGYLTQGPRVKEFEEELKTFFGTKNVLAVDSGTHGIELCLRLAGVQPGDEVICTPLTCVATNMPVANGGMKIVWADVCKETGNIDPESIVQKITPKTKAILYVHWAGNPAKIDAINTIAKEHDLKVIEDAAHAFGAEFQGAKVGTHSDFVMFSFQAIKHLTTGDGGCIICKDEQDYQKGKALRWFGLDRDSMKREELRWYYDIEESGYKFNMNDLDASIGLANIKEVPKNIQIHKNNGKFFDNELIRIPGVEIIKQVEGADSSYWIYTFLADKREELVEFLKKRGITTSIVHTRNDVYTCFQQFKTEPLPNLEEFTKRYISIPCGWWVTEQDAALIVNSIKEFYKE